jgi:hypothetical protein
VPVLVRWGPGIGSLVEALDCGLLSREVSSGPARPGPARRVGGVGAAAYDPDVLLALLIYSYCQGVRSSRQIEHRCATDVAFRVVCAQDTPDHATIARFRVEHQGAFEALFTQVLQVAAAAGLARFGTLAIDGTKIPAIASIDANRGQEWLEAQVRQIVTEAERVDAAEDSASAAGSNDEQPRTARW